MKIGEGQLETVWNRLKEGIKENEVHQNRLNCKENKELTNEYRVRKTRERGRLTERRFGSTFQTDTEPCRRVLTRSKGRETERNTLQGTLERKKRNLKRDYIGKR